MPVTSSRAFAAPARSPRPTSAGASRLARWRRNAPLLIGLSPAVALLSVFFVAPALWALYAGLTDAALTDFGAAHPHFVGLANYRRLWHDPDFPAIVRNSIVFVISSAVIGQTGLGLALALLIDHARSRRYRLTGVAYGAVLLAWICPPIVAAAIWVGLLEFFDGTVNTALKAAGLNPVDWLGRFPMATVVVVDVWRGTAFSMLIFLGALRTVPRDVYEAARVDGAGAWRRLRDHTLPLLRGIATIALLTTTIAGFGNFLLIEVLTRGGPTHYDTETISLYAYHRAIESGQIGFGSAIATVLLLLNLLFAVAYLRLARPQP